MSLIKKLKRITFGRIEAFLDSLEDPAYILPQLQKELAVKLELAINAQAKSLTAVKSVRRKLDELEGKLLRFDRLLETAMVNEDEQLARKTLAAQIQTEEQKSDCEKLLRSTERAYLQAQQVCWQLKVSLDRLKLKARELKHRDSVVKQMQAMQKSTGLVFDNKSDSILDAVARMEDKIIEKESELEVRMEISPFFLEDGSIEELERKTEIDRRLAELQRNRQSE